MLKNQKVLIRTFSAGVHFGTLLQHEGHEVLLKDSRRIWAWSDANTLHEISLDGVGRQSKISRMIPCILLTEAIEIIPCSDKAIASIENRGWSK
jgi:hypothetical protein